ncbi:three component ABC system middle component [Herbaspirillum frisingense]|uniref:Uncharacterized protein n=1 Tax=Herbaspirillum frisingense TaxID=92645 RepID=A0ABU1PBZ1_9BURK|nr:three component ABC system middle component [Herbaspirillum frisingense]MDR6583448.1 hypothetical protein [Herbaspirillum frisingense]
MSTADLPLLQNPSLAAFLLAYFIKEYQAGTAGTELPSFEKLLLVLPLVFHGPTRRAIYKKKTSASFFTVIENAPLIIDRMSERVACYSRQTGIAMNLCCATGLIKASKTDDKLIFSFAHPAWPRNSQPHAIPKEMRQSLVRLAHWFKDVSVAELYKILRIV